MLHCLTYESCIWQMVILFWFCLYSFLLYKEPIISENGFKNFYKENTWTVFTSEKCPQLNTFCNVCISDLHTNKQHIHYIHTSGVCVCTQNPECIYHCAPAALKNVHPSLISCKQQIFSCSPPMLWKHHWYVDHFNA